MYRILIAEDESLIARYLEQLLQGAGYRVVAIAGDASEAVNLAHAHAPHAALVDVKLRGSIDGIELGEFLFNNCGVNVVFVTGDPIAVCRQAWSFRDQIVSKPFSDEDILRSVAAACAAKPDSDGPAESARQTD